MSNGFILAIGFIFLFVGIAFATVSFFLNNGHEHKLISKTGGILFFIIGFMTAIIGLLTLAFHKEITKKTIQMGALFYLILLTVILCIFVAVVKVDSKKANK